MKLLQYSFLLISVCFFTSSSCATEDSSLMPKVTLFVPHDYWVGEKKTNKLIDRTKKAGIDGLAVNVWHGRGATWHSTSAQWNLTINKTRGRKDPLQVLIEKAHKNKIKVIPVVSVSHKSSDTLTPFSDTDGVNKAYNLHDKAFRDFMIKMIKELVLNYDIDGLNLDYIRTKGICSTEECARDYKEKTGRNLGIDKLIYRKSNAAKNGITYWNSKPVIELLTKVRSITETKKIPLSVDSHPGNQGFKLQGADSIAWANANLIDYIFSMNYQVFDNMPKDKLNNVIKELNDPKKLMLLIGNFDREKNASMENVRPRGKGEFRKLVHYAKKFNHQNSGSFGVFTYRFLDEHHISVLKELRADYDER